MKLVLALFFFLTLLHHALLRQFDLPLRLEFFPHLLRPAVFLRAAIQSGVRLWPPIFLFTAGLVSLALLPIPLFWLAMGSLALGKEPLRLLRELFAKKQRGEIETYTFPCEEASFVSPSYPLLRSTRAFLGEKRFSIRIHPEEKPHVIFCFLESFRSKSLGLAPCFQELSRQGIFFSQFYANGILTDQALVSSLFGIPYSQTGSLYFKGYENLPLIGLPKLFKDAGYRTAMIRGAKMENRTFAKAHCFETILDRGFFLKETPRAPCTSWGFHDETVFRGSADWLAQQKTSVFLTLISLSCHFPWTIPPGWEPPAAALGDPFHESYAYADAMFGLWIEELRKQGVLERSILFILGDHGQGLGEHNPQYVYRKALYEEDLRVPLLIYAPGRIATPMAIDEPCSQLDLVPTVLDLFSSQALHHSLGTSLCRKKKRLLYFNAPGNGGALALRLGKWKAILANGREELYDLSTDPEERSNLAAVYPKRTKRLRRILEAKSGSLQEIYRRKAFAKPSEEIHFAPPKHIDDASLARELGKRKELFSLDLSHCARLRGEGIVSLGLSKLNLSGCLHIDFSLIASRHPKLLSLQLSHCPFLTDSALDEVLERCTALEDLILQGNELTRVWAKPLPSLYQLDVLECLSLDGSWADWISALPFLKRLSLSCFAWSDADFRRLKGGGWFSLVLTDCQNIEAESLARLLKECRQLRALLLCDCPISDAELKSALQGNELQSIPVLRRGKNQAPRLLV